MSGKVVSLAARRREPLGIRWPDAHSAPVNRELYDAWVEDDGSLVLRISAEYARYQANGSTYGPEGTDEVTFRARGDAYEVRIPADGAARWFRDMLTFGNVSRRATEERRGVYTWRFEPLGDGTFRAKHTHRTSVFEPFKPRLRKAWVSSGDRETIAGGSAEKLIEAMVAPSCEVCRRVIQVGETAYRERRNPNGRNWPDAVVCSGCIAHAPAEGVRDVGGDL